jgi:hypothetical protein
MEISPVAPAANATATAGGGQQQIRVNAGGPAYTDPAGNVWQADPGFSGVGGSWSPGNVPIANTTTPTLYQSEAWGNIQYQFAVANGTYNVTLKFAELEVTQPGQRMFNVYLNGQQVLQNFDVVAAAGAWQTAVDKEFPVNVTNGAIQIRLQNVRWGAELAGFQISLVTPARNAVPSATAGGSTVPLTSFVPAAPPSTYNAVSDLAVRTKPALPALGTANQWFVDPTFGTRILRVTDQNSPTLGPGNSFLAPSAGFTNNWSADSRHFWIVGAGGTTLIYSFDPANFAAAPVMDPAHPGQNLVVWMSEPWFSLANPNLLYGIKGTWITQYDLSSNTYTPLFDLSQLAPFGANDYSGLLTADGSDTYYSVSFLGVQQTHPYCVVWNRSNGQYTLLNVQTGQVKPFGATGWQAINANFSMGLHQSYIDRTGRYVDLSRGSVYAGNPAQDTIWDTQTSQLKGLTVGWPGHNAMGYGDMVNASGSLTIGQEGLGFSWRGLDLGTGLDNPVQVTPQLPMPYTWEGGTHPSWGNARAGQHLPFFTAVVRADESTTPLRTWQYEIVGIATDGSQKVWRFAHYRSTFPLGAGYDNADPRGTVSPDGRYYMFESNWENTLGADAATGQPRDDIFIVELDEKYPAATPAADTQAPTNLQILSLQSGATVSGTVTLAGTAQDNVGVAGVWYVLNYANYLTGEIGPPFQYNWDTTTVPDGQYVLQMAAANAANRTAETPAIIVNVNNNSGPGWNPF